MAELAGIMVGNYFLLERLACEGIVDIYRARPTMRGGFDVLLRLFRPQFPDSSNFRENFAAEVEKVWQCSHPHILPLLEFGNGDDLLYCVTQLPEEMSLGRMLEAQADQLLPLEFVVHVMTQLCSAIQYIHTRDIVHGNIQPSSVFLNEAGTQFAHGYAITSKDATIVLSNFSMRKAHQGGDPFVSLASEGNALYNAPEQSLGLLRPASDIYALGVLLYHLLAGVPPYTGDFADDITMQHINEPIPSLRALRPDIPAALELVVRVAMAKSQEARFPDAQALAYSLLEAIEPAPRATIFAEPQRRMHIKSRRRMRFAEN